MRERDSKDQGFTLIEMLATVVLLGILVSLVVGPYASWRKNHEFKDAAASAVSAMRNAQVRAVAESTRYRVAVEDGGRTLVVYRSPVVGSENVTSRVAAPNSEITFTSPSFTTTSGTGTNAYFYSRGSASAGSLQVSRTGRDPITIDVEGLTGRVSKDD